MITLLNISTINTFINEIKENLFNIENNNINILRLLINDNIIVDENQLLINDNKIFNIIIKLSMINILISNNTIKFSIFEKNINDAEKYFQSILKNETKIVIKNLTQMDCRFLDDDILENIRCVEIKDEREHYVYCKHKKNTFNYICSCFNSTKDFWCIHKQIIRKDFNQSLKYIEYEYSVEALINLEKTTIIYPSTKRSKELDKQWKKYKEKIEKEEEENDEEKQQCRIISKEQDEYELIVPYN